VILRQERELFPHGGRMQCGIAHIAKTTYRKQRRHELYELYYSINSWRCIHLVYSVVQPRPQQWAVGLSGARKFGIFSLKRFPSLSPFYLFPS
jgi:hypothetical protein